MSGKVNSSVLVKLLFIFFLMNLVVSYENVYDLIERKNQKRYYEPKFRHLQTSETYYDDRDRYYNYNRNPYFVDSSVKPYFSKFGNGYDNLGNGLPVGRFHPFRHGITDFRDGWDFGHGPFQRRPYNDRYTFTPHNPVRNFHRYDDYPHNNYHRYYPKYEEKSARVNKISENLYGSRGSGDISKIDRFLEDNENKKHKKTDEAYQQSQGEVNTDSLKVEKAGERSHTDQSGENKSSLRSNRVVKKGHTTKGFASHHHKDETGNTTTFFDESSDFGGQSDFKDVADGFGTRRTLEQISNTENEKFFNENGGQAGNYGSGYLKGNQKFEKDFSSINGHTEESGKFLKGKENEEIGLRKGYQYLNGDKFEYLEPRSDIYY